MTKYCIKEGNRTICIPVLSAYDPWWWLPKPQPDPWIEDNFLDPGVRDNLATLGAINALAKTLSPELQRIILSNLEQSVEQLRLPENVSIEL
jgi:hypothetical protein